MTTGNKAYDGPKKKPSPFEYKDGNNLSHSSDDSSFNHFPCIECKGTKECKDCNGNGKQFLFFNCGRCSGTGTCQSCKVLDLKK